jgi:hypothetical protein
MATQLKLGVEPPRIPRAVNAARPDMPDGWYTPRSYRQLLVRDEETGSEYPITGEVLVAFLDGWRPCTITQVHEGSLDWPNKRIVVELPSGADLEVSDLGALAIPRPPPKKKTR